MRKTKHVGRNHGEQRIFIYQRIKNTYEKPEGEPSGDFLSFKIVFGYFFTFSERFCFLYFLPIEKNKFKKSAVFSFKTTLSAISFIFYYILY